MTKKELIRQLDDISQEMDNLTRSLNTLSDDASHIFVLLENLPTNVEEIEDDEEKE